MKIHFLPFLFAHYCYCALYFNLTPFRSKCFIDDLFEGSVMMFKWKAIATNEDVSFEDVNANMMNVLLYVFEEDTNHFVFKHYWDAYRGKTDFVSKKWTRYRICVKWEKRFVRNVQGLQINLKMSSDNMDQPDINTALKSKEVSTINREINNIVSWMKTIKERQNEELKMENTSAENTIKSTKWYKMLAFVQIIITWVVGKVFDENKCHIIGEVSTDEVLCLNIYVAYVRRSIE